LLGIQDVLLNPFPVIYKDKEGIISNPTDFPDVSDIGVRVKSIQEPVVNASIIVPEGMYFTLTYNPNNNDEPLTFRVFR
jgi:translation elongation factor EF-4